MCIVAYKYFKEKNGIKLVLGFNRDELYDRKWKEPGFHWGNNLFGCKDIQSSGSWMVTNSFGVIACLLNAETINPKEKKRSRGELPLIIDNCYSVYEALQKIDFMVHPNNYSGFLLYLFDKENIVRITNLGSGNIQKKLLILDIKDLTGIITKFGINSKKTSRGYNVYSYLKKINCFDDKSLSLMKKKVSQNKEDSQMVLRDRMWGTTSSIVVSLDNNGNLFWDYSSNLSCFNRTIIEHHG